MSPLGQICGRLKPPILMLCAALFINACASDSPSDPGLQIRHTIGVIGVAALPGVDSGQNLSAMAVEFEDLLLETGHYQTLRTAELESAIDASGTGVYRAIMANYAQTGQLRADEIRAIQAARLPLQAALIARIEKNQVSPGRTEKVRLRNNAGQLVNDRVRYVMRTQRETQLRATLVDLRSGSVVWTQTYRADPTTESSYVEYFGSSFSGSLAAKLTNTMTNGIGTPSGPDAPSIQLTMRSLMREAVRNMPRL